LVLSCFTVFPFIAKTPEEKEAVLSNGITEEEIDWSTPLSLNTRYKLPDKSSAFDWSTPAVDLDFDWSKPSNNTSESLKLDWKIDCDTEDDERLSEVDGPAAPKEKEGPLDIMGQQVKFIVCLKILMEEISTLSTGYEVDGGQLRLQLYIWLEKEVDALRQLCSYGTDTNSINYKGITTAFVNKELITPYSVSSPLIYITCSTVNFFFFVVESR